MKNQNESSSQRNTPFFLKFIKTIFAGKKMRQLALMVIWHQLKWWLLAPVRKYQFYSELRRMRRESSSDFEFEQKLQKTRESIQEKDRYTEKKMQLSHSYCMYGVNMTIYNAVLHGIAETKDGRSIDAIRADVDDWYKRLEASLGAVEFCGAKNTDLFRDALKETRWKDLKTIDEMIAWKNQLDVRYDQIVF